MVVVSSLCWWARFDGGTNTIEELTNVTVNQIVEEYGDINLICGGWPCQGESSAGLRQGAASATSLLFNDLVNIIHEVRRANNDVLPFLFLENVCSMPKESFAFYERQLHRLMGAGYRCSMFGTVNVVRLVFALRMSFSRSCFSFNSKEKTFHSRAR